MKEKRFTLLSQNSEISFERSHFKISSTDSKVRTPLYSVINSTTEKYYESTVEELLFKWLHCRISSQTQKKVRATSYDSVVSSATEGVKSPISKMTEFDIINFSRKSVARQARIGSSVTVYGA